MPYDGDGDANCLPTNVTTCFYPARDRCIEETCGSFGDSRRPSTCTNRILNSEVACNCVDKQEFSGSHDTCKDADEPAVLNTAVHKKWPMNQDIFNGAHSSCASGSGELGSGEFDYAYKLAGPGFNVCPSTHPYAYAPPYYNYCCKTANSNGNEPQGINSLYCSQRANSCENNAGSVL